MKSINIFRTIVTLVALLLVITAFALYGELEHTVYAPLLIDEAQNEDSEPEAEQVDEPPPVEEIPEEPEPPELTEPEPEPEPDQPDEDVFIDPGYVLLRMSASDISRGHLILINHDHAYVFPDENDCELIFIFDYLTDSLSVTTERAQLAASIIDPLNAMMDAFYEETGIGNVIMRSGYRNLASQRQIFDSNVRRWGRAGALRWAKPPGHSEHHSGLGLDFGLRVGGAINTFTGTGSHSWIPRNSYLFGFILRYPNNRTDITGTNFEPWHYRYVGIPHAPLIRERNWVLEEYIDYIRNYTPEEPLEFTFDDILYQIYFTDELEIRLPYDFLFDISGNNIDGFIVTLWQDPDGEFAVCGGEV